MLFVCSIPTHSSDCPNSKNQHSRSLFDISIVLTINILIMLTIEQKLEAAATALDIAGAVVVSQNKTGMTSTRRGGAHIPLIQSTMLLLGR